MSIPKYILHPSSPPSPAEKGEQRTIPRPLRRTGFPYLIRGERFFPGWLYSREEGFVQDVLSQLESMGFQPEITQYNFCTNGSHYAGEAQIKTFGLGPSKENLAHTVNEYIEVDQLVKVTDCYYGVMQALLK